MLPGHLRISASYLYDNAKGAIDVEHIAARHSRIPSTSYHSLT